MARMKEDIKRAFMALVDGILESLDPGPGPGNAGLWTEISGNIGPKTHKICNLYIAANFACFWAEISIKSPAFPGPKCRSRVQQFQNALIAF